MKTVELLNDSGKAGKQALDIYTIPDSLAAGEAKTSGERQTTFHAMMEIAQEIA